MAALEAVIIIQTLICTGLLLTMMEICEQDAGCQPSTSLVPVMLCGFCRLQVLNKEHADGAFQPTPSSPTGAASGETPTGF